MTRVHLRVRVEQRLLTRLEKARKKSGRTLTGEIISRLEGSFQQQDIIGAIKEVMKQ